MFEDDTNKIKIPKKLKEFLNVDDDGHPISIYKSSDGNEPIVPDYETIFVKGNDHNVASSTSSTTSNSNMCTAVDFDRILNQKMLQTQLHQQNDAYNHREARDSEVKRRASKFISAV